MRKKEAIKKIIVGLYSAAVKHSCAGVGQEQEWLYKWLKVLQEHKRCSHVTNCACFFPFHSVSMNAK